MAKPKRQWWQLQVTIGEQRFPHIWRTDEMDWTRVFVQGMEVIPGNELLLKEERLKYISWVWDILHTALECHSVIFQGLMPKVWIREP